MSLICAKQKDKFNHRNSFGQMMRKYQWYAPPGIPGADVGERRGICRRNLPRGVGT